MKTVAIGIDIGGTFTKFGIVDKNGVVLCSDKIQTTGHSNINEFFKALKSAIEDQKEKIKEDLDFVGVGIGAPNSNYYTGSIEYAPNLEWEGVIPVIDIFTKYYNLPMALTNDANAAAIGEMVYGGAKKMKNFVIVTLGTGLGSGFVVNGELVYGHDGFAGELGHTTIVENGRMCGTGKRGALETYASASGIKRTVFELLADSLEDSELRSIAFNDLTAQKIHKLALKGDKIALEAFEKTGEYLGKGLANTVMHTSPEAIFLFGGLANAGDLILSPTKKYMEENLIKVFQNKVKIVLSQLKETNAAVLGASALIWKALEKK